MSCQELSNIYIESISWNVWSKTCQLIFKRIDCVIGKGSPLKKKGDTNTTEFIVLINYHIHHTKVWVKKNIHFLPLQYHRTLLMHGINRLGWWLQIHTVPSHAAEWDSQQALSCEKKPTEMLKLSNNYTLSTPKYHRFSSISPTLSHYI